MRGRGVLRLGEVVEIGYGGGGGGGGRVVPVLADELVWGAPAAASAALPIRLGRGSAALEVRNEASIYYCTTKSKLRQSFFDQWPVFLQYFAQI